ncbi:DUF4440 domain-containing protein [Paucisalibacillus globulus]|uniref:DUF4440 domain-containing protein n=1 Tax=Paucisalibacillus globulus TaxID=351095 RepID=UPI000BB6AD84|nr:DUF4440 domain-containing protein [Paucisalibacillus globulus]
MKNIEEVLTEYYNSWTDGFKTKTDVEIKYFMSKKFTGYWAFSGIEKPEEYDYDYDIVSVLEQYDEFTHKEFEVLSTTIRKNGKNYLIFGTESSTIQGQTHRAKCLYTWELESGEWKLVREYIEMES